MNINFRGQRLLPGYDFLQSQSDSRPIKVLVHEFIQSVVFTPFPQDSELQVERLILAGNIYESIGFKRKAAFYRRFAALKSVTVQSNWQACYDSLIGSLDGFGLTLDPIEYEQALADKCSSVWPGLHIQLIEELITCCRKIQNSQSGTLAIRHMSFMLHTLDFYLSSAKKRDLARELEEASTVFGEDSPVPLKLSSGFVIPIVNLTKYPLCLKLEPLLLPIPLRPIRKSTSTSDDLFIFTPISMSVVETRLVWAQDEPCTICMVLKNTMPFELRLTMKLLTDGVPLETTAISLQLDANSPPTTVNLVGIPRKTNRLEILGYTTHLLGVKSDCRLVPRANYVIDICPPLPRIEFQFLDEQDSITVDPIPADQVEKDLVVMDIRASMKSNTVLESHLTILNSSNVDVNHISISEQRQRTPATLDHKKLITLDDTFIDNLECDPLKAGAKIDIPITIDASQDLFTNSTTVTGILTFEYSGGLALKEMYCRKCAIRFTVQLTEEAAETSHLEPQESKTRA